MPTVKWKSSSLRVKQQKWWLTKGRIEAAKESLLGIARSLDMGELFLQELETITDALDWNNDLRFKAQGGHIKNGGDTSGTDKQHGS